MIVGSFLKTKGKLERKGRNNKSATYKHSLNIKQFINDQKKIARVILPQAFQLASKEIYLQCTEMNFCNPIISQLKLKNSAGLVSYLLVTE